VGCWLRLLVKRYALNILLAVEFADDDSDEVRDLLDSNDINHDDIWFYVIMLIVISIFLRTVAILILRLISQGY